MKNYNKKEQKIIPKEYLKKLKILELFQAFGKQYEKN